ncbi:MAG: DUF5666 domain-containing protein [Thiogranum sp.]
MNTFYKVILTSTAAALVALTGCGGGGGSVAGTSGIGGTGVRVAGVGIGTTTGFGSVIINDVRAFTIDSETNILRDGSEITEAELELEGEGFATRVEVGTDVNIDFTSGTAVTVAIDNNVKGPVTSINPLTVLGQSVIATGDTVLTGLTNITDLAVTDEVEASGFSDDNNVIQATRIQRKAGGIPAWKLSGRVSNITPDGFNISTQRVLLNGVVPRDCGTGLVNGDSVEVKAAQDPAFVAGNQLVTVTDVECTQAGLGVPANADGTLLRAEVEGLVTTISSPSDFVVGGQRVQTTAATSFEGGAQEDVVPGAKLEAEGELDTSTGILSADKIKFRETRVRIEAPVNVPGGGLGSSFTIMDIIPVNTTSLTEDDDGLVDGSGPAGNIQVEVRGFVDSSGTVFANEVRERGTADLTDVRLRGPATDTCDPLAGDNELAILDVIVDTGDPGTLFNDPSGQLLDNIALCNLVSTGTDVQVENGTFSAAPARIDNAGSIEIED